MKFCGMQFSNKFLPKFVETCLRSCSDATQLDAVAFRVQDPSIDDRFSLDLHVINIVIWLIAIS